MYLGQPRVVQMRQAADPGEAGARVGAIEVTLDDLPDDRPEIAVFPLEPGLISSDDTAGQDSLRCLAPRKSSLKGILPILK